MCRDAAQLTDGERLEYEEKLSTNYASSELKADNCPRCANMCCLPDSVLEKLNKKEVKASTIRARCPACRVSPYDRALGLWTVCEPLV
jgi:predicted dithiol-disulfide oxidoreductase (DUF899 family)